MEISIKRIIYIIAWLYTKDAELVEDIANDECYIFISMYTNNLVVSYEELVFLIESEVIELDSGCEEKGYETRVYKLTETAIQKVQALVRDRKVLSLTE